eukprot:2490-Heterococcus_DN1.PRE.3
MWHQHHHHHRLLPTPELVAPTTHTSLKSQVKSSSLTDVITVCGVRHHAARVRLLAAVRVA